MIYPKFIKPNDVITFVSPSLGCSTEPYHTRLNVAKKVWEDFDYQINLGPNSFSNFKALSSTPLNCAEEINQAFKDAKTQAIISVGGGELMYEILPFIDFEQIKKYPKWFMGFSDNTNLTFLLTTLCDMATIYGPCAGSFAITPWHKSVQDAYDLLTGYKLTINGYGMWEKESLDSEEMPLAPLNLTEQTIIKKIPNQNQRFSGRLIGGCLDILALYPGTKYDNVQAFCEKYKDDGIIWFLEACDFNVMSIRRVMRQLDNAGWFKYVKGFLIGRPLNGLNEMFDIDRFEAVYEVIKKYQVPCLMDLDLGHLPPSMPLITGSYAEVAVIDNEITIEMSLK